MTGEWPFPYYCLCVNKYGTANMQTSMVVPDLTATNYAYYSLEECTRILTNIRVS